MCRLLLKYIWFHIKPQCSVGMAAAYASLYLFYANSLAIIAG